jgi:hypothetical protein
MSSIRTSVLLTLAVLGSSFVANSQEPQDPYKTLRARTFGEVRDLAGKPVTKMRLNCYTSWQATPQVDEEVGRAKIRGVGNGAAFGDLGPTEFRSSIGRLLNRAKPTITNKKGEFRIVVPPIPMKWQIYGSKSFLFVRQSVNATVEVEDGPVKDQELTIR